MIDLLGCRRLYHRQSWLHPHRPASPSTYRYWLRAGAETFRFWDERTLFVERRIENKSIRGFQGQDLGGGRMNQVACRESAEDNNPEEEIFVLL